MKNFRNNEDLLFDEWRLHRHGFLRDGAGREFHTQGRRIVFLLKEANASVKGAEADWDLRDFIDDGAKWRTWNNIARWASYALDDATWESVSSMPLAKRASIIRRVAGVNLKKVPGGSRSDMNVISRFAMEDANWIKKQISLYKPHLVVACGTFSIAEEIFDLPKSRRLSQGDGTYHQSNDFGVLLQFWHPQAWVGPRKLFTEFVQRLSNIDIEKLNDN